MLLFYFPSSSRAGIISSWTPYLEYVGKGTRLQTIAHRRRKLEALDDLTYISRLVCLRGQARRRIPFMQSQLAIDDDNRSVYLTLRRVRRCKRYTCTPCSNV